MADVKKYYYMRLKEDFFDTDEIRVLETMTDGYLYSNILLKMYLKSLKNEGRLMLNNIIPYSPQMIASVTGHQVGTVERALEIFKQLGFIDVLDNGAIYMLEIQNFIGKGSTEADRQREYDRRIAAEKKSSRNLTEILQKSAPEIEIENKDRDRDKDRAIEEQEAEIPDGISLAPASCKEVIDLYNTICISYPKVKSLSDSRKKAIKARLRSYSLDDFKVLFEKAEASSFLKGGNGRDWSATFDWLIKDSNIAKVLDGNYDDKPGNSAQRWNKENEDLYNRGLREWVAQG